MNPEMSNDVPPHPRETAPRVLRRAMGERFMAACPNCGGDQTEIDLGRLCDECGYLIPIPLFPTDVIENV